MAVLKRSVVFVFGKNALYLRLPSQHEDCVVHRIVSEDVHLDVLAPHDKYLVSQYKTGNIRIKGDDFEDCIAREQKMIHNSFMNMSEVPRTASSIVAERCSGLTARKSQRQTVYEFFPVRHPLMTMNFLRRYRSPCS